jgi:uncharacterized protein (TIGR02646 family)
LRAGIEDIVIQLTRDRTNIRPGFKSAWHRKRERELLDRHLAGDAPRDGVWKGAKNQLKVETSGKCAYCEADTSVVAHGDVEHFRPKSEYWWLAYCYDNYAFACQICNQSFKLANFPVHGAKLAEPVIPANATASDLDALAGTMAPDPAVNPSVQQFIAAASLEEAGLPDPYNVNPEPLFRWTADDTLREVEIRPRDGSSAAVRAHHAVVEFLGLNREELRRLRYQTYDEARLLGALVQRPGIPADLVTRAEDMLRQMMRDDSQYAGMVRYLIRDEMSLPL